MTYTLHFPASNHPNQHAYSDHNFPILHVSRDLTSFHYERYNFSNALFELFCDLAQNHYRGSDLLAFCEKYGVILRASWKIQPSDLWAIPLD